MPTATAPRTFWSPLGFLAAFLTVGVPYWLTPYNQLSLPDGLLGTGLVVVIAAAALVRMYSPRPFWRVLAVMGSAVPAAVMARVIVDGVRDATTHNLWPFELVIAVVVGGIAALGGTLLGSLMLLLLRRRVD